MKVIFGRIFLCLAAAVSSTSWAAIPHAYRVTTLLPLPGGIETLPSDINNSGTVLGVSRPTGGGSASTVTWTEGQPSMVSLPANAFGRSLNDLGHIAGDLVQGGGGSHVFLWDTIAIQDIHSLGTKSLGLKLNDADEVVGWFETSAIPRTAYRWKDGVMTNLGTFGGPESNAFDINQLGQVVGSAETPNLNDRAFIWTDLDRDSTSDPGEMVQLPDMGLSSAANAVNDSGVAAGFVLNSQFQRRGAIWFNAGGFVQTGILPGTTESEAFDINNHGQVVGRSGMPFLWDNGQIMSLNSLIPQGQGWTLLTAIAINDRGWIVGEGRLNGVSRGYLLKPIPEPDAFALLLTGAVVVRIVWTRRRRSPSVT